MIKECNVCGELKEHKSYNSYTCNDCLASGIKLCTKCGVAKPLEEFHYRRGKPYICKKCHSMLSMKSVYGNDYYKRSDICERVNSNSRKSKKKIHAERYGVDEEYTANKLLYHHMYMAKKKAAIVNFTPQRWLEACEAFDYKCAYCGASHNLTMEHVMPVSKGGSTTPNNIVPACKSCNSSKGAKDMIEWYTAQPFYDKGRLESILKYLRKVGDAK